MPDTWDWQPQTRYRHKAKHRKPHRTKTAVRHRRPQPWWYRARWPLTGLVWVASVAILTVYC